MWKSCSLLTLDFVGGVDEDGPTTGVASVAGVCTAVKLLTAEMGTCWCPNALPIGVITNGAVALATGCGVLISECS